MNDTVVNPGTISTMIDPGTVMPSGAGAVDIPREEAPEPKATPTIRETLEAEGARLKAEDAKAQELPKEDPKAEKPEVKAEEPKEQPKVEAKQPEPKDTDVAKSDVEAERVADKRSSEGRKEAPARFLPEAREQWGNTPRTVKAEIERAFADHEAEVTRYRETSEKWDSIREFDELATKSGTTLKAALQNYAGIERMLEQDPARAVGTILGNLRGNPQAFGAAIGEVLRYAGTTPQGFAQAVMQNPQAFAAPQRQQQPAPDPLAQQTAQEVQQLKEMFQRQQEDAVRKDLNDSIITPFAKEHPRFEELAPDVARFLKSGIIEETYGQSLTPAQKLQAAYNMAEALKPSTTARQSAPLETQPQDEMVEAERPSIAGTKSIKGAIGCGKEPPKSKRPPSIRDALHAAMQQARAQA